MKFICRHCNSPISPDWQYCDRCGKKLPLKTNQKRLKTAAQILQYRRQNVQRMRENEDILEGVILTAIPRGCDICQRDHGRLFRVSEIVDVPHPNCDCDDDCACCYISGTIELLKSLNVFRRED